MMLLNRQNRLLDMKLRKHIEIVSLITVLFANFIKSLPQEFNHEKSFNNSKIDVCPTLNELLSSFTNSNNGNRYKIEKLTPTSELRICSSFSTPNATCCSKEAEEILMNQSLVRFRRALTTQLEPLKQILSDFGEKIKGMLMGDIEVALRKVTSNANHNIQLVGPSPTEISMNDDPSWPLPHLFPTIYRLATNLTTISPHFTSCLSEKAWPTLNPPVDPALTAIFKIATAAELGSRVGQSFMARLTQDLPLSPDCGWSLTKTYHCQACALDLTTGEVNGSVAILGTISEPAPICRGLCWNVARGCLAHLDRAGVAWATFAKQMKTVLAVKNDPFTSVGSGLDATLAGLLTWARSSADQLKLNVTKLCGEPNRELKNETITQRFITHDPESSIHPASAVGYLSSASLQIVFNEFIQQLDSKWNALNNGRPAFSFIPDQICSNDQDVSATNKNCWDGDLIGRYSRNIVKFGVNSLRNNPEILESDTQGDEQLKAVTQAIKELRLWVEKYQGKQQALTTPKPSAQSDIAYRLVNEMGRLIADSHFSLNNGAALSSSSNRRSIGPEVQDGVASGHWVGSLEDDEDMSPSSFAGGSGHLSTSSLQDQEGVLGSGLNYRSPKVPIKSDASSNYQQPKSHATPDKPRPFEEKDKIPNSIQSAAAFPPTLQNVFLLLISLVSSYTYFIYTTNSRWLLS